MPAVGGRQILLRVDWTDAFLGPRTLKCADKMGCRGYHVRYTHQPLKRTAVLVPESSDFFNILMHSIMVSKLAVYVVCTSKMQGDGIAKELTKRGINFLYYCSDMSEEVRATIRDVKQAWTAVVAVLATPSLTVGINYPLHHFDVLFVYASRHSCCARDWAQTTMRVRHIKNELMYIHVAKSRAVPPTGLPVTYAGVEAAMAEHERTLSSGEPAVWVDTPSLSWLRGVQIANEVEENNKIKFYEKTVYDTLRSCGYTIQPFNNTMAMAKVSIDPIKPAPVTWESVPNGPPISNGMSTIDRLTWLKHDYAWCKFLKIPWQRDTAVNERVFEHVWTDTEGRQKLMNMHMEKKMTVREAHEADFRAYGFAHNADGFGPKLQHIRAVKLLLTPCLPERTLYTEDIVISRERMEAAAAYLAEHEVEIIKLFKVRDRTKADTPRDAAWSVTFLNKILNGWNFVHVKSERYRTKRNGATTSSYKYHVSSSCRDISLVDMNGLIVD